MYRNNSFHPVIKNQFKHLLSLFSQQTYSISGGSYCNHAIRWLTGRATETEFYFMDINEIQGFLLFLKFDSFVSRGEGFDVMILISSWDTNMNNISFNI